MGVARPLPGNCMKRTGAISFEASEVEARQNISTAIRGLETLGVGGDDLGNIQIALAEAVNNIVEHAYAGERPGQVRLTYEKADGALTICLEDDGRPFEGGTPPDGAPANLDVPMEDMPEGGFGWFLIRTLTRDLAYARQEGTNRLMLTFDLQS